MIIQSLSKLDSSAMISINDQDHPILHYPITIIHWTLPTSGEPFSITIEYCPYFNCPYISKYVADSSYYMTAPVKLRHNVWILSVENNDPITPS